ncbi:hypothetical protein PhCBS80983_g02762 [Powellomyces hirtus]|uniref:Dynein assembly factor 3 C-terminal domain-containing protein n=1 Tax=Powellomyces hirtus TaxID=109895 RepID=A0A507E6H4_9FUNG|nr:hypothetical protein PhCBS80983_g02762 [Powellomyces hirtus]
MSQFVVVEPQITNVARTIVLLDTLLEKSEAGTEDKIDTFLELYGNLLVREQTVSHLVARATHYINRIADDTIIPICPNVTISMKHLKFREKDDLSATLNFYRSPKPFDVRNMWDERLRHYYGLRYDVRESVIDWDWNMKMKEKAPTIDAISFSEFRLKGMAFPIRQANPVDPNRTMATVTQLTDPASGLGIPKWGIFSDIAVGPFCPFGLDHEDKKLLREANGKRVSSVRDIVSQTIRGLLWEWEKRSLLNSDSPIAEVESSGDQTQNRSNATIHIFTTTTIPKIGRLFPTLFDQIYVSSAMAHRVPEMAAMLSQEFASDLDRGSKRQAPTLIVESAKFVLDLTKAQAAEYGKRVNEMAGKAGLVVDDRWSAGRNEAEHIMFKRP